MLHSACVRGPRLALLGFATALMMLAGPLRADEPKVTIQGNGTDLGPTPLVVAIDPKLPAGDYLLTPEDGGQPLRANVLEGDGQARLAILLDKLGARETRTFRLGKAKGDPAGAIHMTAKDGMVAVRVGDQPFTTLRQGTFKPYLYPVIGPTGASFTRAYPMEEVEGEDHDHPHQRSFWFTHGNVNGYDFWASDPKNKANPKFGTIKQTDLADVSGGLAVGQIRTQDAWLAPDGQKLCEDERILRFSATPDVRFIDVDVTLKATNGAVTFGDTKEGMFGLRVASSLDVNRKQGGQIVNAEGITDTDAWGKVSPWVDYTGPLAGKTVGVAILNHPESFRYPTAWHVRDYGLFAANPFGNRDFGLKGPGEYTIPAGESIRFRYRVILHNGRTDDARIAAAFQAFAKPPKVTIQP